MKFNNNNKQNKKNEVDSRTAQIYITNSLTHAIDSSYYVIAFVAAFFSLSIVRLFALVGQSAQCN